MVLLLDHWNPVIIAALVPFCGILGYPMGSAAELLDGTLKLRCCITPFSNRFPTWALPPAGNDRIKGFAVATSNLVGDGSNGVKRVRLTRKTPRKCSTGWHSGPGALNFKAMEKIAPPFPPKEWGVRSASLAIFFLELELGEVSLLWGRLEPATRGKGRRGFSGWSVQPKGSVHWH